MALSRKPLKEYLVSKGVAQDIAGDLVDYIIEGHTETVDGLKAERDQYKADAEKLPSVQQQLTEAKEAASKGDKDSYKVKYDALKEEFEEYKTEATKKETLSAKQTAFKKLLADLKISDKRHDAILKISDLDSVELEDGKIKDAEKLAEALKTEWADFIVTEETKGADVGKPPAGTTEPDYSKMTDEEYYKAMEAKNKKE